jgi:hypothetical protein
MRVNWNKQEPKVADKTTLMPIRAFGRTKIIEVHINDIPSGRIVIETDNKLLEERFLNVVKLLNS